MRFKSVFYHCVFWTIGKLPNCLRLGLGAFLTLCSGFLFKRRIQIMRRNLRLCFTNLYQELNPDAAAPQNPDAANASNDDAASHQAQGIPPFHVDEETLKRWEKQHIRAMIQSILDRGMLWYSSPSFIEKMLVLEGVEPLLESIQRKEVNLCVIPHFVGMETACTAFAMRIPEAVAMYEPQRDPAIDAVLKQGRARFGKIQLMNRIKGLHKALVLMRKGIPLAYLPDMDFGREFSEFVPFFNVPTTATLPTMGAIARRFKANVWVITSIWDPKTGKYHIKVHPKLPEIPEQDKVADARQLNALLEKLIFELEPAQYYWSHRRFKTRPEGQASLYD